MPIGLRIEATALAVLTQPSRTVARHGKTGCASSTCRLGATRTKLSQRSAEGEEEKKEVRLGVEASDKFTPMCLGDQWQ